MPGIVPLPQSDDTKVIAQVLWVDHYGNVQLNVGPDDLATTFADRIELRIGAPTEPTGGTTRSVVRAVTFAELVAGSVGLVLDSSGLFAVAMDQRSAAHELGLGVGDQVTLVPAEGGGSSPMTQPVTIRPGDSSPSDLADTI